MPRSEPPGAPERVLFLLTVDTEEEWDWAGPFPKAPFSTANIDEVPAFQDFCAGLGARPTYLVDQAVAEDPAHVALLRTPFDRGECDIGAHLHPWCTAPIEEPIDEHHSHAVNLPLDLFERKLATLTRTLQDAFGCHPHSYRAGRWGVNGDQLAALSRAGYRLDSSVRPFYRDRPFSYLDAPLEPYWPSVEDVLQSDPTQRDLLELPVTSGFHRPDFERQHAWLRRLSRPALSRWRPIGLSWRLGLLRQITLTPEGHESRELCALMDASIERGNRILNLFLHSSDLLPGATPYVRDEADKRLFLDRLRRCVEHAAHVHDARFVTLREARSLLTGQP